MMEMPQVYRPTPRRAFDFTPASTDSSVPPTPGSESQNSELSQEKDKDSDQASLMSRSRSILNLTSSTLLGIYSKTASEGNRDDLSTPWGTGAQTPMYRDSVDSNARPDFLSANWQAVPQRPKPRAMSMKKPRSGLRRFYLPLLWQTLLLFISGIGFGMMVTHLQKTQQIAAVPVPSSARSSWSYQCAWGVLGVIIGNALPRIDVLLEDDSAIEDGDAVVEPPQKTRTRSNASDMNRSLADSGTGPDWHSTVRSIGAFVGIAFAVRKVPWQSTLQMSLTLAIANPVLWYTIDRSRSGFALSTVVGILGTFTLLLVNPDFVPVPAIHQDQASEKLGVYTFLASVLFCTSLCFGAIGRKLQL